MPARAVFRHDVIEGGGVGAEKGTVPVGYLTDRHLSGLAEYAVQTRACVTARSVAQTVA